MKLLQKLLTTDRSRSTLLIRIMVGAIFLTEGIQKFLYPASRGPGRFEGMGFPSPEFWGNFVGIFEIACGLFLLLGFITRAAALAMMVNMTVAILVTKIPIAFGASFGPFNLRELDTYGFWSMVHEMRTDFAMWIGSLFLLIKGSGQWGVDLMLSSRTNNT